MWAVQYLRYGDPSVLETEEVAVRKPKPGERLLIVGAGGAVGLAAIQLAVALGVETDAVCGARAIELCRGLGATRVFDHATPEAPLEPRRSGDYDAVRIAAGHKAAELTELAQLVAAGILRPVVDKTYAVTDLARAHEEFGKGGTAGSRLICHTMP